jgi:uncharacterized cofD-like protein
VSAQRGRAAATAAPLAASEPARVGSDVLPRKRVTVVGGGTGSFNLLAGLKAFDVSLRSIVTMMDSGGDSGELRDAFGVLPPGDLRRCLVALSEESMLLRDLFSFRFDEAPLRGRNFGNLFILALSKSLGSEEKAIDAISKILKIRGQVLPVTWDHAHLHAELDNGETIRGEGHIDRRGLEAIERGDSRPLAAITRVFLVPSATANPKALAAFGASDVIVFAPGDLFTSTIPNLLVKGVSEAICASPAPLVYVVNLMTKRGETDGWSASRHVEEIVRYGGRVPDALLVHEGEAPAELLAKYASEKAARVEVDVGRLQEAGVSLIRFSDIMCTTSVARHDPERTARALMQLFCDLGADSKAPVRPSSAAQRDDD